MTEKLYYENSHLYDFTARVLSCEEEKGRFAVILDRTAFFPEGGGQKGDAGCIGSAQVSDTRIKNDIITHYTDAPLTVGETYECHLDAKERFRRMQNHSGEHIVSGIICSRFGCDNVGFHLGDVEVTIDYNIELTDADIRSIELAANEAVWANVPVEITFPAPDELKALEYRSKLDLTENVRIVKIGDYDTCACCAPHVDRTGEIGAIKILTSMRHRGGVRLTMKCGIDAFRDYAEKHDSVTAVSVTLSAKQSEVAQAVGKLFKSHAELYEELNVIKTREAMKIVENIPATDKNVCVFVSGIGSDDMREMVNVLMERSRAAAVFCGDDDAGYRYVIGSKGIDLRARTREINEHISGKGGGKSAMITGTSAGKRIDIESYFDSEELK